MRPVLFVPVVLLALVATVGCKPQATSVEATKTESSPPAGEPTTKVRGYFLSFDTKTFVLALMDDEGTKTEYQGSKDTRFTTSEGYPLEFLNVNRACANIYVDAELQKVEGNDLVVKVRPPYPQPPHPQPKRITGAFKSFDLPKMTMVVNVDGKDQTIKVRTGTNFQPEMGKIPNLTEVDGYYKGRMVTVEMGIRDKKDLANVVRVAK